MKIARGSRTTLSEVLTLMAATAMGLALDRAYAPSLFTRSISNVGDRIAIFAIVLLPCVVLGTVTLLAPRVLIPRLRWRTPASFGGSLVALGIALSLAVGLMDLVMRLVVALAE